MCIVLVFLKLRIRVKVAVVLGVLDEDVLLHPGYNFRNPKIRILLEKLAYKQVNCPRVPIQCHIKAPGNNENGNFRDQERDMHIWKKELLPVLVSWVAILFVHLDP